MARPSSGSPAWPIGPERPVLEAGSVHVWSIGLDRSEAEISEFTTVLTAEERARAARFHFPRDRDRYIVGRGTLRTLLGRYLRTPPRSIGLRFGPNGKPLLAERSPALHFNLAHSAGLALMALTLDQEVGVDVEQIRGGPDLAAIAPRFFSPRENAQLDAVPAAGRAEAFFQCWTRKEAVIKATGEGLSRPLHSFDVTLGPDRPARLLRLEGEPDAHRRWTLHELRPEPGFVGAIAARASSLAVVEWRHGEPGAVRIRHLCTEL